MICPLRSLRRPPLRDLLGALSVSLLLSLLGTGCIETNFDPPWKIQDTRILSIEADHPEVAPGVDVALRALVADPDRDVANLDYEWTLCLGTDAIFGGGGSDPGCPPPDPADPFAAQVLPSEGLTATLPGSTTALIETALMMAGGDTGGPFPNEFLSLILDTAGVPLNIHLRVRDPETGELLREGFKKVAITRRESPTVNPPEPRLRVGGQWVSGAVVEEPMRCEAESGEPVRVFAGSRVRLEPEEVPAFGEEGSWLESYPIVGLDGEILTGIERASYIWFSTEGAIEDYVTQIPFQESSWRAPNEPGTYPIWVVMRDGHLGITSCQIDVEVIEGTPVATSVDFAPPLVELDP